MNSEKHEQPGASNVTIHPYSQGSNMAQSQYQNIHKNATPVSHYPNLNNNQQIVRFYFVFFVFFLFVYLFACFFVFSLS